VSGRLTAGLDPIETASRDEITALQCERLARALHYAYANVEHYRAAFAAAGVHPDDFRRLDDLAKYPFTTKHDLRANYPFGMFAVPRERIARIHASSGTTGKPTVVGYTRKDLKTWAGVVARSIYAAGGRPGMILHNAYGYGLFTGGLGLHDGAAARLHGGAGVGRHDRAAGTAYRRFPARHHHSHAELYAGDSR
jgi:phenylacetate-CoA ligase